MTDSEKIVRAAAPIFARKGLAGTTTRELAAAAGVSEGTLYNYFSSKRELFVACAHARERFEELARIVDRARTGPLEPALRRLAASISGFMAEQMPVLLQLVLAGRARDVRQCPRPDLVLAGQVFAPRVAAGELAGEPEMLARCFLGLCQAAAFQERVFRVSAREAVDGFVTVFLGGVRRRRVPRKETA